jgi:2-polyprenyl-6-methoxyphenol hydroxylase-like FAD-dependent oxidoreductase
VWRSIGSQGRFAFRRHYSVAPWSDLVEVHWGKNCQAIVTPTGSHEICVALFTRNQRLRIASALAQFPELAQRLAGATPSSVEAGSRTMLAQARAVVYGNLALIGDAACSIDGVAGQGLNLAFQSAIHLGEALAREDLRGYAAAHREVIKTAARMTRLLLLMAGSNWIRRKALRMFASQPEFFSRMISIHAGATQPDAFRLHELVDLGWGVLRA